MDNDILPSAHFVKSVILFTVVIAIVWGAWRYGDEIRGVVDGFTSEGAQKRQQETADAYSEYRNLDTDKDGLRDWEEALFGTDIHKTDTDSDGISDYEEFVAIQSDSQSTETTADDTGSSTDNLGETDSLARDLYTSISIAKQQAGGNFEDADREKLADIAAGAVKSFTFRQYTAKDLTTTPTDTRSDQTKFITEVAAISSAQLVKTEDLQQIITAIDRDASIPGPLVSKIALAENLPNSLVQIKVPTSMVGNFVLYINAVSAYQSAAVALTQNDTDPVRALAAISQFESITDTLEKQTKQLFATQ